MNLHHILNIAFPFFIILFGAAGLLCGSHIFIRIALSISVFQLAWAIYVWCYTRTL
jgi:hypothetical protein